MNHGPSPTREIARFVARILASRQTDSDEVPHLIASVRDSIEALQAAADQPAPQEARQPVPPAAPAPRRRRRSIAAVIPAARTARRAEAEPIVPAAPQLMRRADVAPAAEPVPFEMRAPQNTTLRGVVRWFDLNTHQGTLRLPGFGDEVVIDGAALERAGLSRLYKGQEVEATVTSEGGSVRVVALALPGRTAPAAHGLFKSGSPRRHAKPVVVELKRDAMRRTAARIEAEHILGGGRTNGQAD
jgi:cold shock CspA family protein